VGVKAKKVKTTIGCEQEYFLIDKSFASLRPDILLTGRSLLGADMPKGQQLEDHYFGSIPTRVQAFMSEVENELYRLGVPIKTRHNEVAPSQYEMAPIFEDANVASDHNMLCMEVLRRTADKVGFTCLLHEKPFAGINGSGKHNNWSMATDSGINLLDPGTTPAQNLRFLAVLSCVLRAVYKNQVGLRASIASHGNDHRLGANEAPPAIISVFLGETLTHILNTLEKEGDLSKISAEKAMIDVGISSLPKLPKDNTDRNRTSPFAFTGNKFEFRAVGSSQAISYPVTVLNAAVAESLSDFVTRLREVKKTAVSNESAILEVVKEFVVESKAIRFEGNGYSDEWKADAKKRGLKELLTTPDALREFSKKENHAFLIEAGIYSEAEFASILNVQLERYCKHLSIEAQALVTMVRQYVLPATQSYLTQLAQGLKSLEILGGDSSLLKSQRDLLKDLAENFNRSYEMLGEVLSYVEKAESLHNEFEKADHFAKYVLPSMLKVRKSCDHLEARVADDLWPLPKFREMLFVR
jgi:glutamine synthetase